LLLKHRKINVNAPMNGETALMSATRANHVDIVRVLLRHEKVDVNAQRRTDGEAALHIASAEGLFGVVNLLLEHNNLKVNLPRNDGRTALMVASANGHEEVVENLLKNTVVDVNAKSKDCTTALHIASAEGRVDVVKRLLANKHVDAKIKNNNGSTALDVAKHKALAPIFCDHDEAVKAVGKNRDSLAKVMLSLKDPATRKVVPVELSFQYIEHCITNNELGSGASGNVFFAEDNDLPEPKMFAVKMIKLIQRSKDTNENNVKAFQKELSVCSAICIERYLVWNN
jgi:hypothetical protein